MRKLFIYAAVTLCSTAAALAAGNDAPLPGEKAIAALKQQGTYDSFNAAYTAAAYAVDSGRDGVYQAWNARQRLTARFDSEGILVESAHGSIGLRLVGWGYGSALSAAAKPEVAAGGKRIEYRRDGLMEWYVNEAAGIEQGFTLTEPPARGTSRAPLTIALTMRGPLQPELTDQGRSILLRSGGKAELRYAGLKASDASGRDLSARMELAGTEVHILVDDASAEYPVTIDPAVQQAELTASDGASQDQLGYSVSMSGNTVVAGALNRHHGTGAAYVFVRTGTTWTQQAELTASDGIGVDFFGWSVSVHADTVVVGAIEKNSGTGAAYVFVRTGTTWTQQAELTASDGVSGDGFGGSASVIGDTAVVGASLKNNNAGAAYVFVRLGTVWTQQAELTASDGASNDGFGQSVSMRKDTVVLGAAGKNNFTGAAYVFVRSGTTWTQQAELTASDGVSSDAFGASVSVSADTVVAGAVFKNNNAGAAYVFVRSGTVWTQQAELTNSHDNGGQFGTSVSVDGDTLAAGAPDRKAQTGAAYVFMRSGTVWTQRARLTASDGVSGDYFGISVSVSGDTVIAGAFHKNNAAGAAYVFIVQP